MKNSAIGSGMRLALQSTVSTALEDDGGFNFTGASQQMHKVKAQMGSVLECRLEKVRAIQDQIENGAYQIHYDVIAENMLSVLMNGIFI
jgi:anti-sigma28 factor (negative regulator of flagellin synthesis)